MKKHRRKLGLVAAFSAFMLLGSLLPPNQYGLAAVTQITVTGSGTHVNVRSGPGTSYQIVDKAFRGNNFRVLGQDGDWYKIQLSNGKEGWIANWLTQPKVAPTTNISNPESSPAPVISPTTAKNNWTVEITGKYLNVRSGPGTNFSKVTQVNKGTQLTVIKAEKDWFQIRLADGKSGWVAGWLVEEVSTPTKTPVSQPNTGDTPQKIPTVNKGQSTATITGPIVNLRTGPGTSHPIAGKVSKGQVFTVVTVQGEWVQIQFGKQKAWVAGWLVKVSKTNTTQAPAPNPKPSPNPGATPQPINNQGSLKAKVTADSVNIRSGPGTSHSVVSSAGKNDVFNVMKTNKDWLQISLGNNKTGWIADWLVQTYIEKGVTPSPAPQPIPPADSSLNPDFAVNKPNVEEVVVITGTYVNVRSGPGTSFGILGSLNKGDKIPYIGIQGDWVKANFQGKTGWLAGWLVKREVIKPVTSPDNSGANPGVDLTPVVNPTPVINPTPDPTVQDPTDETGTQVRKGKVIGSSVLLRSEPHSEEFLGNLTMGMEVEIIEQQDDWFKVRTETGQEGWVVGWLIQIQEALNPITLSIEPEVPQITLTGERDIRYSLKEENADQVVFELLGVKLSSTQREFPINQKGIGNVSFVESSNGLLMIIGLTSELKAQGALQQNGSQLLITFQDNLPLAGKIIALDAGHGGLDPGAVGQTGLQEKVVVWDMTVRIKGLLEAQGAKVILTRADDTKVPLVTRAEIANKANADIFVSIHANANTNRSVGGISTYYYAPSSNSTLYAQRAERRALAQSVQNSMVKAIGLRDIGILEGNFSVLRNTKMPSILVETAFLSNAAEEKLLAREDIRVKFSESIVEGVMNYFK